MTSRGEILLETALRGEMHHAVILQGRSPDDLRSLALDIARTLNCVNGSTGDECDSCRRIGLGIHPDVHVEEIAENRSLISVSQIRSIVAEAGLKPYEGRNKVFIIDPADAMSAGGANSLLKTLEEPVSNTFFVLLTRSADRLLPTIRSRCQLVTLQDRVSESESDQSAKSAQEARILDMGLPVDSSESIALAKEILTWLDRYSTTREISALLATGRTVSECSDAASGLTILSSVLHDLTALVPEDSLDPAAFENIQGTIEPGRLLDAATTALRGIVRLQVHTDSRLMAEQAMLRLDSRAPSRSSRRLP